MIRRLSLAAVALAAALALVSSVTATASAHSIPKRWYQPVAQANVESTWRAADWLTSHGTKLVPVVGGNGDPDNPDNYVDGKCRGVGKSYRRLIEQRFGPAKMQPVFAEFDCVVPLAKWIAWDPATGTSGHADYNDVVTYKLRVHALAYDHWLATNVAKVS